MFMAICLNSAPQSWTENWNCFVKDILQIRFAKQFLSKQQKIRCEEHDTWQANKLPYDFYIDFFLSGLTQFSNYHIVTMGWFVKQRWFDRVVFLSSVMLKVFVLPWSQVNNHDHLWGCSCCPCKVRAQRGWSYDPWIIPVLFLDGIYCIAYLYLHWFRCGFR